MNKKMLALYGLKWNPFAPDVPVEALHISRRIESFCWRVEQLVGEGGFALVTGAPGAGKSVTLRILAERLAGQRDVKIGILSRPQAGLADFYREMGDLFAVELAPHTLRLDLEADRNSLADTVARLQPRLLILDPFVRLHRIDENASGEVAPLLAYLRELQRRYGVAVLVVHHARKGAGNARAGQALRGSSEFHAWGDSNLYLRRDGDDLTLTVEHRAAPSLAPIAIALMQRGPALALEAVDPPEPAAPGSSPLDERIAASLADIVGAMPFAELRTRCRVRAATLYEHLAALTAAGHVVKTDEGYRRAGN